MNIRDDSRDLTVDESQLIRNYKQDQNKPIPDILSVDNIWATDFDTLDYPDLDYVSALGQYLDELEPYVNGLIGAADWRQLYYEEFYNGQKDEEEGLHYWRVMINDIADDAIEKFNYWNDMYDEERFDTTPEYGKTPKVKTVKAPKAPKTPKVKTPKGPTLKQQNEAAAALRKKNKVSIADAEAARRTVTLDKVNKINEMLKTHSVEDVNKHLNKHLDTHVNKHLEKHLGKSLNVNVSSNSPPPFSSPPPLPPRPTERHQSRIKPSSIVSPPSQRTLPPARTMAPTRLPKTNQDDLQSYSNQTTTVTNKGGVINRSSGGATGIVRK